MMRLLIKTCLIAFVLYAAGSYVNYLSNPISTNNKSAKIFSDNIKPAVDAVLKKNEQVEETTESTAVKNMYRWRDENGVIHISSDKPENKNDMEIISYTEPEPKKDNAAEVIEYKPTNIEHGPIPDNIYSPEGVKQLIEQAKAINQQINTAIPESEQAR